MTTILAALFYLVVTVHGEVRHQAGPMTADQCALQMAFAFVQINRIEAAGQRVVIAGRIVERDHVKVRCLPGERAS
jgi:hypothetical protein